MEDEDGDKSETNTRKRKSMHINEYFCDLTKTSSTTTPLTASLNIDSHICHVQQIQMNLQQHMNKIHIHFHQIQSNVPVTRQQDHCLESQNKV